MKFLSAQPDNDYFIWQVEVQIHNFKKYGFEFDMLILFGYDKNKGINPNALKLKKNTYANIFFIPDTREDKSYISSIRPHIIKKFYDQNKVVEPIFYHDSDIVFLKKPDLNVLINSNTEKIFLSDTISYIGGKYIISKSEKLLDEMCNIVGIDKELVINNENNSGGAQYLIKKSVDSKFWEKVEKDSVDLYNLMKKTESIYSPKHPIQSWCADMWAILWNFWYFNIDTEVKPELDFIFPVNSMNEIGNKSILHNAGVTNENSNKFFYKGDYIDKIPYNQDFSYVSKNHISYLYVKEIIETGIYKKRIRT